MTKLIVVLGVTGTQGGSVASTFLKLDGWHVRGVSRNTESEGAKAQTAKGVEIVKGDLSDVESLKAAFQGAHAIFVATDFWSCFASPAAAKEAETSGKPLPAVSYGLEFAQAVNAAKAASDPTVLATLERFVFSTLPGPKKTSGGKYKAVYHFDSKADAEAHIRQELPEVAKVMSLITMGVFTENWKGFPYFAPHKQDDGSYKFLSFQPPGTHKDWPMVVATRDTGAFIEALVTRLEPGTHLLGASEIIKRADYVALWAKIRGVKAVEQDLSEEEFRNLFPEVMQQEMVETFSFIPEYGYTMGNPSVQNPWDVGIPTTSMEQHIREEDWDTKASQFY